MTRDEARTLLSHCAWADRRVIEAASALDAALLDEVVPSSFGTLRATLGHLVASEWIWLNRWRGRDPRSAPAWATSARVADLARHLASVEVERDDYLAGLRDADLVRVIEYESLEGGRRTSRMDATIRHVALHAAHHRGQASTQLRQLGVTPPNLAYLAFERARGR